MKGVLNRPLYDGCVEQALDEFMLIVGAFNNSEVSLLPLLPTCVVHRDWMLRHDGFGRSRHTCCIAKQSGHLVWSNKDGREIRKLSNWNYEQF